MPTTYSWTGTVSTDYATASNWQTNSVPTAANPVAFNNNAGTVTGTGNALDVSIAGTGTWTFAGTSITVAGAGGNTPGIQVDGNANVTGSTASLNASSSPLVVGDVGTGNLTINAGATVVAGTPDSTVAPALSLGAMGTGNVGVFGANSQLTVNGVADIGGAGTGSLTLAEFTSYQGNFFIGEDVNGVGGLNLGNVSPYNNVLLTGGFGTVYVNDYGNLTSQTTIDVGVGGDIGAMSIIAGGQATADQSISIGNNTSIAAGTTLVTQSSTTIASSGTVLTSSGTVSVQTGGNLTADGTGLAGAPDIIVGAGAESTGVLDVTGGLATVSSNNGAIVIGSAGSGMVDVTSGGNVNAGTGAITIGNLGTVVVDTGSAMQAATLTVSGTGGNGALTIGASSSVVATQVNQQGEILVQGGSLNPTGTSQIIVNNGADITGAGVLGDANTGMTNSGSVIAGATGGFSLLTVNGTVGGTGGAFFIDPNTTLEIAGLLGAGQHIEFNTAPGVLQLDDIGNFQGTIGGPFSAPTSSADSIVLQGTSIASDSFNAGTLTLYDALDTAIGTLDFDASVNASNILLNSGTISLQSAPPCFAAGTHITTSEGAKPVEQLAVGDIVRTTLSRKPQRIVWIGHRRVDCTRHPKPQQVWPVRISVGAFGRNLPARDLYLSPDHAVYADGVLIPVKYLANNETIAQVPCDTVTYYHVELAQHDVILAENLPTESYLDTGDRGNFENGGVPMTLHPDFASRVWEAEGCAPLVVTGPEIEAVRRRVNAKARRRVRGAIKAVA
jgi:collagen type I alpha